MRASFARCGARRTPAPSCCRAWPRKASAGSRWQRCSGSSTLRKATSSTVLAHVAYALPPLTREERAAKAKVEISTHFNSRQQVFLAFVLSHYVRVGVEELDREKLRPLLLLKYHNAIADAVADLGRPEEIGNVFAGFQKYLYQDAA